MILFPFSNIKYFVKITSLLWLKIYRYEIKCFKTLNLYPYILTSKSNNNYLFVIINPPGYRFIIVCHLYFIAWEI